MSDLSQKFMDEFPNGVVPTDRPPVVGEGDLFTELARAVARHDRARSWDVDALDWLRDEYLIAATEDGDTRTPVVWMMQLGLTLRQIARYVGVSAPALLGHDLFNHKSWGKTEQYLRCDELLAEGQLSVRGCAREVGLPLTTAQLLSKMRLTRCAA